MTGFKRADLYPRAPFPMQNVEASVAWQQGVWTAALADGRAPTCRDCGMSDLPVEGGCRCPYCFELWLLRWERDPAGAYEIAMGRPADGMVSYDDGPWHHPGTDTGARPFQGGAGLRGRRRLRGPDSLPMIPESRPR